jgi:hypothetical protein
MSVVEIGHSAAIAFAGRLLGSLGVFDDVMYVDTNPVWSQRYPGLTAHLRHGKRQVFIPPYPYPNPNPNPNPNPKP